MSKYENALNIGLREKGSGNPVVIFPKKIIGTDAEIEEKVKFWFYQQDCSAEEKLKNLYVDILTAQDVESLKK